MDQVYRCFKGRLFKLIWFCLQGAQGKVATDPKSSWIRGILCTFFYEMSEIISAVVHQLDVPPEEKEKLTRSRGSTRDSLTYRSYSVQMPPIEPHPEQHDSPSQNLQLRKVSIMS